MQASLSQPLSSEHVYQTLRAPEYSGMGGVVGEKAWGRGTCPHMESNCQIQIHLKMAEQNQPHRVDL